MVSYPDLCESPFIYVPRGFYFNNVSCHHEENVFDELINLIRSTVMIACEGVINISDAWQANSGLLVGECSRPFGVSKPYLCDC